MPATATAPAPAQVVVGPVLTQGGFQYWYLVCFSDSIVAVRQSIGAFFMLGLCGGATHQFGLLGVLMNHLVQPKAEAFRQRTEFALKTAPVARLRTKSNLIYEVGKLRAISYKQKKGAPLILSDLILETMEGKKMKYGINPAAFEKASAQLKQMYPTLFHSI
jgi:hypothetical protein